MIYFTVFVFYALLWATWVQIDRDAPFLFAQLKMGYKHGGTFMMQAFGYTVALVLLFPMFAFYRIWVNLQGD